MEEKEMCTKIIKSNSDSPKIYKPKPKKICITYKTKKSNENIQKSTNIKHYPLSPISSTNYNIKNNLNGKINLKSKNGTKTNVNKNHKFNFDDISLKEIENDFSMLKAKSEVIKAENELYYLLRNSTKDNSVDDDFRQSLKIKRPKNPFLENLE